MSLTERCSCRYGTAISTPNTAAVVKKISTAPVKSLAPDIAAKLFEMKPHQFDSIDQPVDVLFGHNRVSIFPTTERVVVEAALF